MKPIYEAFNLDKKPTSISGTLRKVRNILKCRKRWTKGANFRRRGIRMDYDERALADCACLNGALLLVVGTGDLELTTNNLLTDTIEMCKPYHSIQQFNDLSSTTHKEVLQVLTKAIAIASKQEKAQCRKPSKTNSSR